MKDKQDHKRAREIGRRIAQARQEAGGMTQRELGELIGVTDRSIMAYESGDVIPFRFLRQIEDATGRSAGWILHGDAYREVPTTEHMDIQREMLDELRAIRALLEGGRGA